MMRLGGLSRWQCRRELTWKTRAVLKLPNFFIVGAAKAGTTSLCNYLDQHPQVFMSPLKEPSYFASELRPEYVSEEMRPSMARQMRVLEQYLRSEVREKRLQGLVSNWEDYLSLYRDVRNETAIGEATTAYLWSPTAARNIAARIPHARIVVSLRNPADRAYSQYLQMLTAGVVRGTFREQINASLNCKEYRLGSTWPLLEYGRYYGQVTRYLKEFPRSQIHISLYEELQLRPLQLVADLFAFLGVDPAFVPDLSKRHNEPAIARLNSLLYYLKRWGAWPYVRRLVPVPLNRPLRLLMVRSRGSFEMDAADRVLLTDYYREDIKNLALLLDRDLSSWLEPPAAS
jgi:hypothetical protein